MVLSASAVLLLQTPPFDNPAKIEVGCNQTDVAVAGQHLHRGSGDARRHEPRLADRRHEMIVFRRKE